MQFCLFGSYGQSNIGDEAIADGIHKTLTTLFPGSKIILFSHNVEESKKLHPQFTEIRPMIASGFRSFREQLKSHDWQKNKEIIQASDWVIIGGGGIFHDKEIGQSGLNPLFIWWLRSLFFKRLKKKIIIWGVGVGPLEKSTSKFFLKSIFKRADIITVRDEASLALSKSLTNKQIHVIPDPVWGLYEPKPKTPEKEVLGINIRESHRLSSEQLVLKLTQAIQELQKKSAFTEIQFIPFALKNPDDRGVMKSLMPELQKQISLPMNIIEPKSPIDAFSLVRACSQFIAMRFHSYIFAKSADIPCTLLSYSSKTDEIQKYNKDYYLDKQEQTLTLWERLLS